MKKLGAFLAIVVLSTPSLAFPIQTNDFSQAIRFPFQDSTKANYCQVQLLYKNNEIIAILGANNSPLDSLYITRSTDEGNNWSTPVFVAAFQREPEEKILLSGIISKTGRIIVVFSIGEIPVNDKTKFIYSDDNGTNWSLPQNVISTAYISYPKITETQDGKLWIVGRINYFFFSTNNGTSWSQKSLGFSNSFTTSFDLVSLDSLNYLTVYDKYDINTDTYSVYYRRSTNSGDSWSEETILTETNHSEKRPRVFKESNGTLWLVTQTKDSTTFTPNYNIYEQNISYRKSTDNGNTWSATNIFTGYLGYDGEHNIYDYNDKPIVTFLSDRWSGKNQIWMGHIGITQDTLAPPVLFKMKSSLVSVGVPLAIRAFVGSSVGIQNTELIYEKNNIVNGPFPMFDDGNHDDGVVGDNIWGAYIGTFDYYDKIKTTVILTDNNLVQVTFPGINITFPPSPFKNKWLSMGSLHNWYSSRGSEIEQGFVARQQFGLRWPGIYKHQDAQASKGFWIGATNFTDENGRFFPYKVVHVGPRANGEHVFYPKDFKLVGKFDQPQVFTNNYPTQIYSDEIDEIDPNLPCDRMIYNLLNTQLGITIERKIYQFSQEFHDGYTINQYTFTNTGNVDYDDFIELPANTVEGIYFYYLYRWAINSNTRYVIGNATGWGINTMLDTRGDGVMVDPPDENFRAQYAWHGNYLPFTLCDNLGGPIWNAATNVAPEDTIGRLGAPQFVGVVTLHADNSASDSSDNINQPFTTSWESSDDYILINNDPFNDSKMAAEYVWLSRGHKSPRHANVVEPSGNFSDPTGDPALGTTGGFSSANGYGPYSLGPGESVTITWAEAVGGIDRQAAIEFGIQYKQGQITAQQKNVIFLTGKDSLFQTFRKAIANYNSDNGFIIPQPPHPPTRFAANSGEDKINLNWKHSGQGPQVKQFEIYRTSGDYDSVYQLIHIANPADTSFIDSTIERGFNYFYYIQAIGDSIDNNGQALTPLGSLKSSRYYTQTYDPVSSTITGILQGNIGVTEYYLYQNYPNPFNPVTTIKYSILENGFVNLRVYNLLGEKVATLVNEDKPAGSYDVEFNASSLPSGIYFYRIQADSFVDTKKMILMK